MASFNDVARLADSRVQMAVTHDIQGAAFPVAKQTGVYCTVQARIGKLIMRKGRG